jgi:hypothetical protein
MSRGLKRAVCPQITQISQIKEHFLLVPADILSSLRSSVALQIAGFFTAIQLMTRQP